MHRLSLTQVRGVHTLIGKTWHTWRPTRPFLPSRPGHLYGGPGRSVTKRRKNGVSVTTTPPWTSVDRHDSV